MNVRKIEQELDAARQGEPCGRGQIPALPDAVDRSEFYRRDSDSMTQWITKHEADFSLKPAMLWRHLSAGRYLEQLASGLMSSSGGHG